MSTWNGLTKSVAQLITNGSFTGNILGWTVGTTWRYGVNNAESFTTSNTELSQNISASLGNSYQVDFDYVQTSSGGFLTIDIGSITAQKFVGGSPATGHFSGILTVTGTSGLFYLRQNGGWLGTVDNVVVSPLWTLTSKNTSSWTPSNRSSGVNSFLLLEDGFYLLLEDGTSRIILEQSTVGATNWTATNKS